MKRELYAITFIRFLLSVSFSLSWPFIPLYLNDRGLSVLNIGIFITSAVFVATFLRIFMGNLADIMDRVILLRFILSFRFLMLVFLAIFVSLNFPLTYIFMSTFLKSLGFSLFLPVADSYVADISDDRGRVFSLVRIAINGGWAIGTFLGSFILRAGYVYLFLASSIGIFLAIIFTLFLKEIKRHTGLRSFKMVFPDYSFIGFSITSVLVFTLSSQLTSNFSLFAVKDLDIPKHMVAYLFSLNGLLIILFQLPITKLLEKLGYTLSVVSGGILFALGYIVLFLSQNYTHLIFAVVFITLGEMFVFPVIMASASNRAPEGELGAYMGFWSTFQGMGYSLGPSWGGLLFENFNRGAWLILSLQALIASFLFSINPEKSYKTGECRYK
ncbi:MAG: MFS transporter [candidate division WOR-3 bacterium]